MDSRLKFYLYASSVVNAVLVVVVFCTLAFGETIDLDAICEIESACLSNPATKQARIYNPSSKARGAFQITEICLQDYNNYHKKGLVQVEELFNYDTSRMIADWYLHKRIPQMLKYYKKEVNIENILTAYNCGISCVGKTLPRETTSYIKKYKKLTEKE